MTVLRERAPAKVNLCLFLGPTRADGRHELVTLFESVSLYDELSIEPADRDEVACPAVPGPNLVSDALARLRTAGWDAPPVRVTIEKRIPVAAGMGGGSADAAAMLRAAPRLAAVQKPVLRAIASGLGADVPAQLRPGASLGTGAGEVLEPVQVPPHGILVLPSSMALSTPEVYREADRLSLGRSAEELGRLRAELRTPSSAPPLLGSNDLEPASLSLCPSIADGLHAVEAAGADQTLVCGSGPTVIGLFWGEGGAGRAAAAAEGLPGAIAVRPLAGGDTQPAANPPVGGA